MTNKQMAPWQQAVELAETKFNEVLPIDNPMQYAKEAEFAMQAIEKSKALKECSQQSLINAVVNVASIGLSLNPATKHAYIVPRGGVAVLDISYKGLVRIATDCGGITSAKPILVYKDDEFIMHSFDQMPTHNYKAFATERTLENVIGGYCAAKLSDGTYMVDTMSRSELDKIKDTSKAKSGPWVTWPEEMMKKSLVKRASKSWPETPQMERFHEAVNVLNQHEGLTDKAVKEVDEIDMPVAKATGPTGETVQASSKGNTTVAEPGKVDTSQAVEGELVDPDAPKAGPDLDGPAWEDDKPAAEPVTAKTEPAADNGLTDGMKKLISAMLKQKSITEESCLKVFGYENIDQVNRSQMNKILDWIKGQ